MKLEDYALLVMPWGYFERGVGWTVTDQRAYLAWQKANRGGRWAGRHRRAA